MIAPISDGTVKVVWVRNSIHTIPASAPGSAMMMMSGSSQLWKFTTSTMYTSRIANTMPRPRPVNEVRMLCTCPRMITCVPLGSESFCRAITASMPFATAPRSRRSALA